LDTNILIAFLNGDSHVIHGLTAWRREGHTLCVSSISVAEVLSFATLAPEDLHTAKQFLETFVSIPLDNPLAEMAAILRRMYRLGLPDAAIAATAIRYHLPLVTRDKDFQKIRELTLLRL
jgi:predicted nucleic acid-binding protein